MELKQIIESLSPNERKILPFINEKSIKDICKKSNLDKVSVLRALEYLQNKGLVELDYKKKKFVELGLNGINYKKKELPERKLLNLLSEKRMIPFKEAQEKSKLSKEEFKAALGVLKKKAMIEIKNGKIILNSTPEDISKKFFEEQLIEKTPLQYDLITPELNLALSNLLKRKNIIEIKEKTSVKITPSELGKKVSQEKIEKQDLIEALTPELLKKESNWKGKKFRRYDLTSPVPKISGGKRHFVNQSLDYTRKIWTEMGFQEMTGDMIQSSFWNFDALFQPQDHPARDMQDTFFLDKKTELPENKDLIESVKKVHETGLDENPKTQEGKSRGWRYQWSPEVAKQLVLRTHTTGLSAQTLYELSKLPEEKRKGKFFALGKNFRNETIDWKHGFEFYQTEGIVIDENANFRHLLGYLQEFYKKMGFPKVRFRPGYFPYTEPSVEIEVWHPEKKQWLEFGGAGMFRPEVTKPILGKEIPVLAWGQGFDRIIMDYYNIKDLRELYKNDLKQLREIKFWIK